MTTTDNTVVGARLTKPLFERLAGALAGHPYVKIVVDRAENTWHVLDTAAHSFHVRYIATCLCGMTLDELEEDVDAFNASVYTGDDRRFLLGILSLHTRTGEHPGLATRYDERPFMVLETTEADTMGAELLTELYTFVRARLDDSLPLLLKPATHAQESALVGVPESKVPRILSHELFAAAEFVPLNIAFARGRLRHFSSEEEYRKAREHLTWYDIVAMPVVPDDIPRVAGLINGSPTTPLSHTNVLAAGWGVPNAIVRDIDARVHADDLDGAWVHYEVSDGGLRLSRTSPPETLTEPHWQTHRIRLDPPDTDRAPVTPLNRLRAADRVRFGTKAANLGELHHILRHGSTELLGYYSKPRPPRPSLLPYLQRRLRVSHEDELRARAAAFLARRFRGPDGLALPFSLNQRFLASSPTIQQCIGKLKMALELNELDAVDALCLQLQGLIRTTTVPVGIELEIRDKISQHLGTARPLVVRSSSNAEDLPGFSAAGIYDSVVSVAAFPHVLDAIRQVWASLLSPRSVRLRHQAGISLDDTYMGVIVQRYAPAVLGGVMVTCDPTRPKDFRGVYLNCAADSADVVDGRTAPLQYLYNTVEGGGRTVSLGAADTDVEPAVKERLADLALAGRLLQSHFAVDDPDASPLDVEWLLADDGRIHLLQIRPYSA
ncbi:PEP/pyruvate-binding domain-containing protein [Streptomyces sp. TRM64462]|uniref:PEP/pyruvate-binding domain-containing protein n=1 Tax=Streptomyces sp. TRM64462 TaxID=2741726 RepID=UPI0028166CB0|nr:PEP/pyruvate-binding domain-containing protein [Streptomyces sp. TRM64462]